MRVTADDARAAGAGLAGAGLAGAGVADASAAIREAAARIATTGESPARSARDPVNLPMIHNWVEAMSDVNPVYTEAGFAVGSLHGGLVAPPAMAQVWTMRGLHPRPDPDDPLGLMSAVLDEAGFTSVVATNCEQEYYRYLRHGEHVTVRASLVSVTGPQPALGAQVTGHDLDGVERRLPQRGQVRVGPAARVAVVAVVEGVTAAEVLVPAGLGELVEPDDRLGERGRVHADLLAQLGDGRRPVDRARPVPAARQRPVRRQAGEDVAVAVALVGDQPGRDMRAAGTVAGTQSPAT
jgi:hypothetical protein